MEGKIISKLSGYGFINSGGRDFFFHKNSLRGVYFNALEVGQMVVFEPDYSNPKGPSAMVVYAESNKTSIKQYDVRQASCLMNR
jgi:cold shock CspA family protein